MVLLRARAPNEHVGPTIDTQRNARTNHVNVSVSFERPLTEFRRDEVDFFTQDVSANNGSRAGKHRWHRPRLAQRMKATDAAAERSNQ